MFPEGENEGLYHTADATLWFFHALDRYVDASPATATRCARCCPTLRRHRRATTCAGTRFGIGVDPRDGLLRQGAEGYQLTWMDAKVDDWVVTPRRGKAVEINALWYNALRLLERLAARRAGDGDGRRRLATRAERARDVVQPALLVRRRRLPLRRRRRRAAATTRPAGPNQVFAISLDHPGARPGALGSRCWTSCATRLLTPVGLRSLAPGHPRLQGAATTATCARATPPTTRARSGRWLIGPFVDAWLQGASGRSRRRARACSTASCRT